MNKRIVYKSYTTSTDQWGSRIDICTRFRRSRKYRHTVVRLAKVSSHWIDKFDDLTGHIEVLYCHHFTFGVVVVKCR